MEPLTVGLALAAGLGYLALKGGKGKKTPALPEGGDPGFQGFAPEAQQKAWYMATSIPWTATGSITDNGAIALTYRGQLVGDPGDAKREANDTWLRGMMAKDYRIVVSDRIVVPEQGQAPYLIFVPSGFKASSVPGSWGPMLQLYAPPPGWLQQANQGQPIQPGQTVDADPFNEIPDPGVRQKVRALYMSDTASIADLESTASDLEKYGWGASAKKLRDRAEALKITRSLDAKNAGGYLYVVRTNDLPIYVAQFYGGQKPGVLAALAKINPKVAANKWAGWVTGAEVLLPIEWGDPQLKKGTPPLAQGQPKGAPGGQSNTTPGNGKFFPDYPAGTKIDTPWGAWDPNGPPPPGTTTQPGVPGTEPYLVVPSNTVPAGVLYGPAYKGKYTPPTPGKWDDSTIDNASNVKAA